MINQKERINEIIEMTASNLLPLEFDGWDIIVPEFSIERDYNSDFSIVINPSGERYPLAIIAARYDILPEDFTKWEIADSNGWSAAHEFIKKRRLPENFIKWIICDKDHYSVAHCGATYGNLPTDFNNYEIADLEGWSVGHEAARYDNLQGNFNHWNLKNSYGISVRNIYNHYKNFRDTSQEK